MDEPTQTTPLTKLNVSNDDPYLLRKNYKSLQELKNIKRSSSTDLYNYYKLQNQLILDLLNITNSPTVNPSTISLIIKLSLLINTVLLLLQLIAAILTNSLSLYATLADSFMDLISNLIIYAVNLKPKDKNLLYPTGKSRLETVGLIIFAALMSTVSFQLIIESVKNLVMKRALDNIINYYAIGCIVTALISKFVMFLICYRYAKYDSNAKILALDHRNDIYVNVIGLIMMVLGTKLLWWFDGVGCLLVALIILRSWTTTALEQVDLIVGKSAEPELLNKLTYLAVTHHQDIIKVDTCRAYYSGSKLYAEVDIVLSPDMKLINSHDIGESLQFKLESLNFVERAFVHIDYESSHAPEH